MKARQKMKLIIELDDDIAKGIRGENDCKVEPREIVRSFQATIADAIANGTPYNPSGDCISREALKKILSEPLYRSTIKDYGEILKYTFVMDIIDNAPPVSDRYDEGYAQGYVDGSTGADWREIK